MSKVPFTVSARTAKLIGQENFANAEGAIIELVKNAYDADAKNCIIIFDNDYTEDSEDFKIYIIDNGIGMTSEVIKDHWMKIGTDDKLTNFLSDGGRVKTGAKGIGRFALDRLGEESEMFTLSKKPSKGLRWSVKWSDFEQFGVPLHKVKANLDNYDDLNIKSKLLSEFEEYNSIKKVLRKTKFASGTILKVISPKDNWDENDLNNLFDNLEVLIPPAEQSEFVIHLFSTSSPADYGEINSAYYDDYDYKVSAKYLAGNNQTLKLTIVRNELEISQLESSYKEVFNHKLMKKPPFDLGTLKRKKFVVKKKIFEILGLSKSFEQNLIQKIGDFEFTFYYLKNKIDGKDKKKYPYKSINPANRKAWLKKFGGIKIFRDDFRVRPYGENGQDWLGLGDRQSRSPGGPGQKIGGFKVGSNQISGTIRISRIANANFNDKSGREGIQENDAFVLFKNILLGIISIFEKDRNIIMFCLSELAKKRFKDEEEKRKAQEEANRILSEQEEVKNNNDDNEEEKEAKVGSNSETEVLLAKATKIYEQEIEDKNEEIRLLRGLASVGLIISSFAHELHSLRTRLTPRMDFLLSELKKYITKKDLSGINKQEDPFYMIQLMKEEDLKLFHWLNYSLSALKRDKRKRTNINIGEYFEKFKTNWAKALKQRKVKVELKGSKNSQNIIRGFEVDLDAIFNNLLSNSLTAFKQKKGKYDRIVKIEWKVVNESIKIIFSDNGCGISQEYKTDPERIFDFNESSKTDRKGNKIGTGVGLYIAKLVIDDYNGAKMEILPKTEGFSLQVNLPKRKNKK